MINKIININLIDDTNLNTLINSGTYIIKGIANVNNNLPNSIPTGEYVNLELTVLNSSINSKNIKITQYIKTSDDNFGIYKRQGKGTLENILYSNWEQISSGEGGNSELFILWDENNNLNDILNEGVYFIKGYKHNNDNIPILNDGPIAAKLTVISTDDNGGNKVVTQVLNLNNNHGGEGNIYIHTYQNGHWKPWGKLQTNIEVGQVTTLDNLVDNGIYSGVLTDGSPTAVGSFYDTFVLIVLNNYSVAGPLGTAQSISQLKYSLKLDSTIEVAKRKRDEFGNWTEWESIATSNENSGKPYTGVLVGNEHLNLDKTKEGDVYLCLSSNVTIGTGDYPSGSYIPLGESELCIFKDNLLLRGFESTGASNEEYKVYYAYKWAPSIQWNKQGNKGTEFIDITLLYNRINYLSNGIYESYGVLPGEGDVGSIWRYVSDDMGLNGRSVYCKVVIDDSSVGDCSMFVMGGGKMATIQFTKGYISYMNASMVGN